MLMMIHY